MIMMSMVAVRLCGASRRRPERSPAPPLGTHSQLGDDVCVEPDDGVAHENDGGSRIGPRAGSSNSTPPIAAKWA